MKTIAFFVHRVNADEYPFSDRELYFYAYQEFFLAIRRAGGDPYFVSGLDTYLGEGAFSQAWTIDEVTEVKNFKQVGPIKADIVFNKSGLAGVDVFRPLDIPTVTDTRLYDLMGDKAVTNRMFGQYQPKTVICEDKNAVQSAIAAMPGERIVVKNPRGNGGRRVYIGSKTAIDIPEDETYPLIVQEFIDMSDGIPGLASGIHDVRILMTGSTIIGATLRIPAAGSLYANVSQGATESFLTVDQIPGELIAIVRDIDGQIADYPRYYAIDFARGKQGWVLVELNKEPGLFREADGPLARSLMDSVARYLMEVHS